MKYFAISAVLLMTTLAAHTARADDFEPFGYLTVGASRSSSLFEGTLDDALEGPGAPSNSHVGDSWGANVHAGYRFHKYLAAEVEYEWMKNFSIRNNGVKIADLMTQVATANLKVVAPYGAFEPYFLAGFGVMFTSLDKAAFSNGDVDNGAFAMKFGVGVDYWVTKNMSLSLGAEICPNSVNVTGPTGSHGEGIDYLSGQFGVGFRF